MIDGITTGGQSFIQSVEEMVRRLERLEKIVTLFASTVLPYKAQLSNAAFVAYLESRCSDDTYDTAERPWKKGHYTREFTHKKTYTHLNLANMPYGDEEKDQLLGVLLTIASLEERMPARVLVDIQPDVFSAVDAIATVAPEET